MKEPIAIIDLKQDGLTHTASNWAEFTRMLFNLGERTGLAGEALVMAIGRTIDGIIENDGMKVIHMEKLFGVEFDWDPTKM
jgi:hypothetical protein